MKINKSNLQGNIIIFYKYINFIAKKYWDLPANWTETKIVETRSKDIVLTFHHNSFNSEKGFSYDYTVSLLLILTSNLFFQRHHIGFVFLNTKYGAGSDLLTFTKILWLSETNWMCLETKLRRCEAQLPGSGSVVTRDEVGAGVWSSLKISEWLFGSYMYPDTE